MGLTLVLLTAIGLSIDGFAISVIYGTSASKQKIRIALKLSVIFGIFHVLMPLIGYLAGTGLKDYIETFDHWVAFLILLYIGIKMILEEIKKDKTKKEYNTGLKVILYLAFATSIDALAVGISFSLIDIPIFQTVGIIGISAFSLSFIGVWFGGFITKKFNYKIQIIGGIILIAIGVKILIEHLYLQYFC